MNASPTIRILPSIQSWLPGGVDDLCRNIRKQVPEIDVEPIEYVGQQTDELSKADVLITNDVSDATLDRAESLEWLQVLSSGVAKYPLDRLRADDILLTNASGVHAEPIAEQVLGYVLLFERRLLDAIAQQNRREWRRHSGREIQGRTLGVIGLGEIGRRVAERAAALDLDVIGTKRTPVELESVSAVYDPDEIGTVLAKSHYIILTCPLTSETVGLIRTPEYEAMQSDAILINVARSEIAPEDDLVDAIRSQRIRGAAVDVFESEPLAPESPLWDLSNVVVTPHSAGTTPHYFPRCADIFVENYRHFVDGRREEMPNRVL